MKTPYLSLSLLLLMIDASCTKESSNEKANIYTLKLNFVHYFENRLFEIDSSYKNAFSEDITVRNFKYYVTNIEVEDALTGNFVNIPNSYFLIDEKNIFSKTVEIAVYQVNRIKGIRFLIGVDSFRNISNIRMGALDVNKGMFETADVGYISAKLEGTSSASTLQGKYFSYHIGGFKTEEKSSRSVYLDLTATPAIIDKYKWSEVAVKVDVAKWFNGKHPIRIKEYPICHDPGELATKFADNYATMFSTIYVKNL